MICQHSEEGRIWRKKKGLWGYIHYANFFRHLIHKASCLQHNSIEFELWKSLCALFRGRTCHWERNNSDDHCYIAIFSNIYWLKKLLKSAPPWKIVCIVEHLSNVNQRSCHSVSKVYYVSLHDLIRTLLGSCSTDTL